MKYSARLGIVGLLLASFMFASALPAMAQPGRGPRPPFGPPPPPPHHHHRGPSDLEKSLFVLGAVGAVAAAANGYSSYGYYRQPRPVVVVDSRPPVVVERPVVVEKQVVIEKPVVIEKTVPVPSSDYYSPKMGATFVIQKMKIPGYSFTAARLTSDPVDGSPLKAVGLAKGDVVTRLDNDPADSLDVLERHEKATLLRYIKTGTTRVQMAKIYIPTDDEFRYDEDVYYAP